MTMPVIVVLLGPLCDPGFVSDQDTHGLAVPDACPGTGGRGRQDHSPGSTGPASSSALLLSGDSRGSRLLLLLHGSRLLLLLHGVGGWSDQLFFNTQGAHGFHP